MNMNGQTLLANHDHWDTTLYGETLLFNLLGKLIYKLPDHEWLQYLSTNEVFTESPFAVDQPDVAKGLALITRWLNRPGGIDRHSMQDLNDDNLRLFIGIGRVPAPVWES